jgi:hypothetical protein
MDLASRRPRLADRTPSAVQCKFHQLREWAAADWTGRSRRRKALERLPARQYRVTAPAPSQTCGTVAADVALSGGLLQPSRGLLAIHCRASATVAKSPIQYGETRSDS